MTTLPTLTGTDKQVAWADKIRTEIIAKINTAAARPGNELRLAAVAAITDAATLIDIYRSGRADCIIPEDFEVGRGAAGLAPIVAVAMAKTKLGKNQIVLVTRYQNSDGTAGKLGVSGSGQYETVAEAIAANSRAFQSLVVLAQAT
jgi:hypothetical protein